MTLQDALSLRFDQLVPAQISKTTLTFLTESEFATLAKHMHVTIGEHEYDTITVGQTIFKKEIV